MKSMINDPEELNWIISEYAIEGSGGVKTEKNLLSLIKCKGSAHNFFEFQ